MHLGLMIRQTAEIGEVPLLADLSQSFWSAGNRARVALTMPQGVGILRDQLWQGGLEDVGSVRATRHGAGNHPSCARGFYGGRGRRALLVE